MPAFHSILLPLDLSDSHDSAVTLAARLLEDGGQVVLLHVIELIPGLDRDEEPDFYARLETAAQTHLDAVGGALDAEGIDCQRVVLFGRRTEEILRFSEDESVDLILVSSHAVDPTAPVRSWGTVSYQVGVLARCPVLLVK